MSGVPRLRSFRLIDELLRSRDRWPGALVDEAALRSAVEFTENLPEIFNWLILETRAAGPPKVDLLAAIIDINGERASLEDALAGETPRPLATARGLLESWSRGRDPALEALRVLWFEWDAPFERATPLVLPAIDPRFWGPPGPRPRAASQVELADAVHRAVHHDPQSPAILERLISAITALPDTGRALSSASLRPRGIERSRLFVGLPRDQVMGWLEKIQWPGDLARAARLVNQIFWPWEQVFLQIEVADHVTPYLGLEPRQHETARAEVELRRVALSRLAGEGIVSRGFVDAVIGWSGSEPRRGGAIAHRNFHLKHVLERDGSVDVKAYFGLYLTGSDSYAAS